MALRRDTARTRDRLLDTAGRLLAERGLAFSLPDLAKAGGVATATVYRHFEDIRDVHREFYYRLIDQLVAALKAVPGDGTRRFADTCARWVELAQHWGRAATRIRSPEGFLERVRAGDPPTSELHAALAPVVRELIASGEIPDQDTDYAILVWITLFDERVIVDLTELGWPVSRIAQTLSASVLGAWQGK
ncbi:TetR/AcrR family transcriptional regulator [Amycolatopsis acidicola]|uniref:TetR/AcrR family transcriptional regulator n=1 Tax=Amycolatopsis acidicola TaxID=2596893 RepID=A0A5N0VAI2_9PSEU|nr:TetR/AcrR family transcriptional regulator [Amycolatopsis acidicola]KAA9162604.1 TetR/AcrR family transcriptional regulator [Amycolatopsis acidicola]